MKKHESSRTVIGITGYGSYVPRLRMSRQAIAEANAWYAPQFVTRKGTRSLTNWDEDSITMAVAASRDCLGPDDDRDRVRGVFLASTTLPYAERLNAGIVAEALTLDHDIETFDVVGSQRAALSAVAQALARARSDDGDYLVAAADNRKARPASTQEMDFGDGAAALLIGSVNVLAEYLGGHTLSLDFIDRFRATDKALDYTWEERWVRDEGIGKLLPQTIAAALAQADIEPGQIDHFVFPTTFQKMDRQLAKHCGLRDEAVADAMLDTVGETGAGHALLMLARVLERAKPDEIILLAQFGSGAHAMLFRVTEAIAGFHPAKGLVHWLAVAREEVNYTKFLSFKGQIALERGMRGEQDHKTALSTAWRHKSALLGLVAGRCEVTGSVHFPPSRISYDQGRPLHDTQRPYKLAERRARILSWSAESLSFYRAPPHHYGQIDFEGGGRILMEFTDIDIGEIDSGMPVEMSFRIKDIDEQRGFIRYFWKAVPIRAAIFSSQG